MSWDTLGALIGFLWRLSKALFHKIYPFLLGPERKVIVGDISASYEGIVAEFIDCSYVSCSFLLI